MNKRVVITQVHPGDAHYHRADKFVGKVATVLDKPKKSHYGKDWKTCWVWVEEMAVHSFFIAFRFYQYIETEREIK